MSQKAGSRQRGVFQATCKRLRKGKKGGGERGYATYPTNVDSSHGGDTEFWRLLKRAVRYNLGGKKDKRNQDNAPLDETRHAWKFHTGFDQSM
jgi:hypothetical protein